MNNDQPAARLLRQPQRVGIRQQAVWVAAAVDVTDVGVPFTDSTHTLRIVNVAEQAAVLIPFDRSGLERLRQSITAALDSHTQPTQRKVA